MAAATDGGGGGGGRTIKLFKFIQKSFQGIGIYPPQLNQTHNPINPTFWLNLFCHAQFFVSSTAYLLFEADSMIEYGLVFFIDATVIGCFIFYLISFWETKAIFNYIENCERFVEKSEYTAVCNLNL